MLSRARTRLSATRASRRWRLATSTTASWLAAGALAVAAPQAASHLESRSDPPGAAARTTSLPASPARGGFQAVQVNVDAAGSNIVGDAANEPSIAVDPGDPTRMVIGWRQFDTIASNFRQAGRAYSHDAGRSWVAGGTLDPGVFRSDPVLDVAADGTFYYYSLKSDFSTDLFVSETSGVAYLPFIPNFGGDKNWMAVDRTAGIGAGNLYFNWSIVAGCCGPATFSRSTDGGATYLTPVSQPTAWGTMSVGPTGTLYAGGIRNQPFDTSTIIVARSASARDPALTPTFGSTIVNLGGSIAASAGPNPGGLLGQVWVATDHSGGPNDGNVYVLASVDPPGADPLDVRFARSTDGGATFSPAVTVNDDAPGTNAWQWFGTMSVAPNGRIDAVWNDTRNDPTATFSELFHSSSSDGGVTWSPGIPVTVPFNHFLGYPQQNKLGDYYGMVSDNLGASVAFAATFNGEQDVYHLRIGPYDCNRNDVDDATDVALGTSRDDDGDGIPDECETPLLSRLSPGGLDEVSAVYLTRATPGSPVLFLLGTTPASLQLGCGATLGILDFLLLGLFPTDATGALAAGTFFDSSVSGVSFLLQVFDVASCRSSNVISHTFP